MRREINATEGEAAYAQILALAGKQKKSLPARAAGGPAPFRDAGGGVLRGKERAFGGGGPAQHGFAGGQEPHGAGRDPERMLPQADLHSDISGRRLSQPPAEHRRSADGAVLSGYRPGHRHGAGDRRRRNEKGIGLRPGAGKAARLSTRADGCGRGFRRSRRHRHHGDEGRADSRSAGHRRAGLRRGRRLSGREPRPI